MKLEHLHFIGFVQVDEASNKEIVTVNEVTMQIKKHLALNKTIIGLKRDPRGSKYGFFKYGLFHGRNL